MVSKLLVTRFQIEYQGPASDTGHLQDNTGFYQHLRMNRTKNVQMAETGSIIRQAHCLPIFCAEDIGISHFHHNYINRKIANLFSHWGPHATTVLLRSRKQLFT